MLWAVGGADKVSINAGVESVAGQGCCAYADSFWKFSVPLTLLTVSDEVPARA